MWKWGRTKIDRQIHLYVLHIFQRTSIHRFGCWCQVIGSQTDRNSFHRRSSFFFVNSGQILTPPSVKDRFWFVVICMYWMIPIVVTPSARNSDILIKCVPRVLWSLFSACLPICDTMISFIHSFHFIRSYIMCTVVIQVLVKLETNQKTLYVPNFWILHVTGLPAFVDVAVRLVDGSVSFPQAVKYPTSPF